MLNHFEELCNLCAVSGDEGAVRDYVCRALEGNPTVSWQIDPLGNLLVEKKGAQRAPHHLMVSAHMDEVGLIVTHVQDGGLLEIAAVGGVDASVVIGRQFLVGRQHIPGIVGTKPVHLLSKEQRSQLPTFDGLVLDIGASSAEEARKLAPEGTCAYFCPYFRTLGDGRVCSKAIDDRAGCALLLGLLEQELPYDITAAFLVQEEIGLRGATAAAYTVAPEFALVLEATTAADIVGASGGERVCTLGGGPVISFMDRSTMYDKGMYQAAFAQCQAQGIPCQTKTRIAGGNDSGAIHVSRGGVRTLAVSLPCRYLHSPSCVADLADLDAFAAFLPQMIQKLMEEDV
ncbi:MULTISPECIES: M42 family peptidase [Ruminococcus]|uniref:M42 family metallopeptidase n=1 Tax=Ruminococcus TaxID=1263 RepID=UPI001D02F9BD|nr:M42 family peptidase [Ruminococcus callidus]MCB5774583.1 M42 family peptidase [Ruminococcus callidus]MCC2758284.1 M42 family peptidase [Ruminococcus callidus]